MKGPAPSHGKIEVIEAPQPFSYGAAVKWIADDGGIMVGSIFAFNLQNGTASVELGDGSDVEVSLKVLTLV